MAVFTPGAPFVSADPVVGVEGLTVGSHRFRLEVEDESGNRSAPDEATVVVRLPAPLIAGFRPGFGAWGDEVVVVGTGFDSTAQKNEVFVNGVNAPVLDGSPTELRVRVPQPAATGTVRVRNAGGEANSARPFIIPVTFVLKLGGPGPVDLAAEPRRGEVWVIHGTAGAAIGAVSVLALQTRDLVATLAVERGPRAIAIAPPADRQAAAVTNGLAGTTTVIDVAARQIRGHVKVDPNPNGVAFRPDGRVAYVVCQGDAAVATGLVNVIDVADTPRVVARIEVGRTPQRVVFSPDGKLAFVNETGDGSVAIIDANPHRVVDRIKVGGGADSQPSDVAASTETFPLLTANPGTRTASIVQSNLSVKDLDTGFAVNAAAISARTKQGWLAGPSDKSVPVVDLGGATVKRMRAGGPGDGPKSVVASADGRAVFIANLDANTVSAYDAESLVLQAIVRVPEFPTRGIATADGKLVCFICAKANQLVAIEVASVLP